MVNPGSMGKRARRKRDQRDGIKTHILRFPPGRVVTFTKLIRANDSEILSRGILQAIDSPAVIQNPLLSTTFGSLLLLLLFDLGGLRLDFAGTGKRSVN